MSEALVSLGHDIHIVTYPFGEDIPVRGAKVWRSWFWRKSSRVYSGPSLEKIFLDIFLLFKLCQVIRRERISIIHAHNYEGVLIGFVAKLFTGRPLLYNAVNLMSDELPMYKFLRPPMLAKWVAKLLDSIVAVIPNGFIAITSDLRDGLLKRGVSADRIALVPCGVDLEMFEGANPEGLRARYDIGDRPLVMYTGITGPIQRIDYLLQAFSSVLRQVPDALLMVVSPLKRDADMLANRSLADALGTQENVIWVEGHELSELPNYLALASVAVISRPDVPGHPIKLLNYMAAARPIVCSAGAAKGVRHMLDAFLVPDHEPEQLADGIVRLLRDRTLAQRLGANARKTVSEHFDWRILCAPVSAMYQYLVQGGSEGAVAQIVEPTLPKTGVPNDQLQFGRSQDAPGSADGIRFYGTPPGNKIFRSKHLQQSAHCGSETPDISKTSLYRKKAIAADPPSGEAGRTPRTSIAND
jgi:glycosyltransferase involved in cell wall biosynthesis